VTVWVALLLMTVAICVTVLVYRWIGRVEHRRPPMAVDPESVLRERYARGEIDESEFSHRLSVLRYGPPLELH
jgi:putative membrane protein